MEAKGNQAWARLGMSWMVAQGRGTLFGWEVVMRVVIGENAAEMCLSMSEVVAVETHSEGQREV